MSAAGACGAGQALPASTLTITGLDGRAHQVKVEVAADPASRETGLMRRKSLAANSGMLFVFPKLRPVQMWMKDTLIPLDMLFIDADGKVIRVKHDAKPLDLTIIDSGGDVSTVLELNAGYAARQGVTAGARVTGPAMRFRAAN